jgi:hypothetical protein
MNDGHDTNWDPTKSLTVPIFYFIIAGVIVLTYFFGWMVLAVFVALWAAAWLFAYFDDKRHAIGLVDSAEAPFTSYADITGTEPFSDVQGNCLKCGGRLFHVDPGATTAQEIIDFAGSAKGWEENAEALAGWMPPGVYCAKGCVAIPVTPIPIFPLGSANHALSEQLDQFEDLLALAERVGKGNDVYAKQKSFVAYYRRGRRRFVATSLLRHRYRCEICKQEIGEAELYIEDPGQPIGNAEPHLDWGLPAGRFYATQRSRLHGILAHDAAVPEELAALCAGVKS